MNFFAINAHLERAAARRHQRQRTDVLLQLEQFFRQTDGVRFVVSGRAIFDGYVHAHDRLSFGLSVGRAMKAVKRRAVTAASRAARAADVHTLRSVHRPTGRGKRLTTGCVHFQGADFAKSAQAPTLLATFGQKVSRQIRHPPGLRRYFRRNQRGERLSLAWKFRKVPDGTGCWT